MDEGGNRRFLVKVIRVRPCRESRLQCNNDFRARCSTEDLPDGIHPDVAIFIINEHEIRRNHFAKQMIVYQPRYFGPIRLILDSLLLRELLKPGRTLLEFGLEADDLSAAGEGLEARQENVQFFMKALGRAKTDLDQ